MLYLTAVLLLVWFVRALWSSSIASSCRFWSPWQSSGTFWMRLTARPGFWSQKNQAAPTPWGGLPSVLLHAQANLGPMSLPNAAKYYTCSTSHWSMIKECICVYRKQRIHQSRGGSQTPTDAARMLPAGSRAWWVELQSHGSTSKCVCRQCKSIRRVSAFLHPQNWHSVLQHGNTLIRWL